LVDPLKVINALRVKRPVLKATAPGNGARIDDRSKYHQSVRKGFYLSVEQKVPPGLFATLSGLKGE
jgi:hypothetical protein